MSEAHDELARNEPTDPTETSEKQPYTSPELWEFGSLEDLTRTATFGSTSDGGMSGDNLYTGTA